MPGAAQRAVLSVKNLQKSYGNVAALAGVSLDVYEGQVLALAGDNGAGKSTLIKILSGAIGPDNGEIYVNGQTFDRLTPAKALQNGITTVYQDLALVNCRDIPSNVFLGREPVKAGIFVDRKRMNRETEELLRSLKVNISRLDVPAGSLSGGQRQALAIARAINAGGKALILDEPTAAMGIRETSQVMALIAQLRDEGMAIVLVSHSLHQIFSIADRVCVLRHGKLVADLAKDETDPDQVARLITGIEEERFGARREEEKCLRVAAYH